MKDLHIELLMPRLSWCLKTLKPEMELKTKIYISGVRLVSEVNVLTTRHPRHPVLNLAKE